VQLLDRDLRRAIAHVVPYWRRLALVLTLSLVSTVAALYIPYLTRLLIDRALLGADSRVLVRVIGQFAALTLGSFFLNVVSGLIYTRTSAEILFDMRLALFRQLQRLSPRFYAEMPVGQIATRLNADIGEIQRVAAEIALAWVGNVIFLVGSVVILFRLDRVLFAVSFAIMPISLWALVRYRARPESHVTAARFIDTGAAGITNANNAVIYQPELALVFGSFHMQGEYQWLNVERGNGSPTLNFHGWYAQAGWFLTGEVRRYLIRDTPDSATFGRVRPRNNLGDGGFGAFEIAARYSGLDLSDRDVRGGTERNITLGLNWYVNPYMRFMFNYIRVNNDNEALGNVANLIPPNANGSNDDPRVYQLRGQVDF